MAVMSDSSEAAMESTERNYIKKRAVPFSNKVPNVVKSP